jgi:predicted nucleotidyltransferase
VDFGRPLEALIPGAPGRLLGALARVEAELPVSTLAAVAGVGRTRASAVLKELAELGVISRRQVGPTVLVRLERANAAGQLLARLGGLRVQVIEEMRGLARDIDPQPLSLTLFGSFVRGDGDAASDIDILAVRPAGGGERWAESLTGFSSRTQVLTGNRVQILDYDLSDLRRRYAARGDAAGARFWRSVARDALTLAGADLQELMEADRGAWEQPAPRQQS